MERLTERDEYGNADIIGVDIEDFQLSLDYEEFCKVTDALNKLADYEDREQGCVHCIGINMPMWWSDASNPSGEFIFTNFCPSCGRNLRT